MTESTNSRTPFASSALAKYLDKKVNAIKGIKTESDIAKEILYNDPRYISMWRRGEGPVPFDIISPLAFAISGNPVHLWRLALEQRWPDLEETLVETGGTIATAAEHYLLLKKWREATDNMDPISTPAIDRALATMFAVVKAEMSTQTTR